MPLSNVKKKFTKKIRWAGNDPPMFFATVAGVIAVVAYTSVAAWQACLTRQAMVGDQRAWIAPISVQFDQAQTEPTNGTQIIFSIAYRNTGKSPALELGDNAVLVYTDKKAFERMPPIDLIGDKDVVAPSEMAALGGQNVACKYLRPIDGGLTVFPSDVPSIAHRRRPLATTADIAHGEEILMIYGCFAYRSFSKIRMTAFCYYAEPAVGTPFRNWALTRCPNGGNYAN